jgi:hypothetical protein
LRTGFLDFSHNDMSEITLKNINDTVGAVTEADLRGARFYMYCPKHQNVHSFPAHRERCNIAIRKYFREKYNLPEVAGKTV